MSNGAYRADAYPGPEQLLGEQSRRGRLLRAAAVGLAVALGLGAVQIPIVADTTNAAVLGLGDGVGQIWALIQARTGATRTPAATSGAGAAAVLASTPARSLIVVPKTAAVGSQLVISGSGFSARAQLQLTWDGVALGPGALVTDANGAFQARVNVPSSSAGAHAIGAAALERTPGQPATGKLTIGEQLAAVSFLVAAAGTAPRTAPAIGSTLPVTSTQTSPPPEPNPTSATGPTSPPTSIPTATPSTPATAVPTATPSTTATAVPTPTTAPTPTSTPSVTSTPTPPSSTCPTSLQALVDSAASGAVISAPACIYREALTITRPMTLRGQPGAEIRGSDVWSDFAPAGSSWVSGKTVPQFGAHGECRPGTSRCLWPEQVFVDGVPQLQVGSSPAAGQFALDGSRHVVLGSDPTGRLVEVTVRTRWIVAAADDVTIDSFRMRHAANDAQSGGIQGDGAHARLIVRNCVLSDAHGAVVSLRNADSQLLNSDISRGGQLGIHGAGARAVYRGNRIHNNNTESFDPGWEAGGFKSTTSDQTVDGNEVYSNDGPGIWFDIHVSGVTISRNRVHHNRMMGIFYEISGNGRIISNSVWENGWGFTAWGWGAGILLSTSNNTEVSGNVLAWNADGISVIGQSRGDSPGPIAGNYVHDNVIVVRRQPSDTSDISSLGWLQDAELGMFDASRDNRGANNVYYIDGAEPSYCRFQWAGCLSTLAAFNATPGDEGGRYLTATERDQALVGVGIPTGPEAH